MSKNNTKKPSKYGWIFYAAILVFIAVNLFGGLAFNSTEKTTTSQLEDFMKQGDVAKVVIITNTRQAKVFLTQEALSKEEHREVSESPLLPSATLAPQYVLDFGDLQNFENKINELKREYALDTVLDYDKENNYLLELLISSHRKA